MKFYNLTIHLLELFALKLKKSLEIKKGQEPET